MTANHHATTVPGVGDVKQAIRAHREGFAALGRRRGDSAVEDAIVAGLDLALALCDNPYGIHGTSKKLVADLVPGDHVHVLDRANNTLVWRVVSDDGVTSEHDDHGAFVRVHFIDSRLDLLSGDEAVTVDAPTALRNAAACMQAEHVATGIDAVQQAMSGTIR